MIRLPSGFEIREIDALGMDGSGDQSRGHHAELISRRALAGSQPGADDLAEQLSRLPATPERCVIINVHTDALTAVAARSAVEHGARNLLIIDCDPTASSRNGMRALAASLGGVTLGARLRRHGDMLDLLFSRLRDETILLVDSDLEVRSDVLTRMRGGLSDDDVYGSGWTHGPSWLPGVFGDARRPSTNTGWYLERPWIPCALLRVPPVAEAIRTGAGFREGVIPNDLPALRPVNRLMLARFYVPGLRRARLSALSSLRRQYDGVRPNYCYADTGALLHHALRARNLRFVGPNAVDAKPDEVVHQHGASRTALAG